MNKLFMLLAVALAALGLSGPASASGALVFHIPFTSGFSNNCNGELVDFEGTLLFVIQDRTSAQREKVVSHAAIYGRGVGDKTGLQYVVSSTFSRVVIQNSTAGVLITTVVDSTRLVTPGPETNEVMRLNLHLTMVDGEPKVDRSDFSLRIATGLAHEGSLRVQTTVGAKPDSCTSL